MTRRTVAGPIASALLPRYRSFSRHLSLTLANSPGRLFEPVVPPEDLLAVRDRGHTSYAPGDRFLGCGTQLILHRSHLNPGEYRARVELTRGGRDEHVVDVAQIAPARERLAERG